MAELRLDDLLYQCRSLEEQCLFAAQGHYETAKTKKKLRLICVVIPALIAAAGSGAALMGGIIPSNLQSTVSVITALAAIVAALSALFEVDGQSSKHLYIGHQFNALRLEVNHLHKIEALAMPLTETSARLERYLVEYRTLVRTSDLTDQKAFERARKAIEEGIHEPSEIAPLKLPPPSN